MAFTGKNLAIFNVPQQTEIGCFALYFTKLFFETPFKNEVFDFDDDKSDNLHNWIKNINNDQQCALNRACSSFQPLEEIIRSIIENRGIGDFAKKNEIGITPSRYLQENPHTDVKEMDVIRGYVMKMMGNEY